MLVFYINTTFELKDKPGWLDDFRRRYDDPHPYHVTLHNPAFIDRSRIPELKHRLSVLASGFKPLQVEFDRYLFGETDHGKLIMIAAKPSPELMELQSSILEATSDFGAYVGKMSSDFDKDFRPHLTIARHLDEERFDKAKSEAKEPILCRAEIKEIFISVKSSASDFRDVSKAPLIFEKFELGAGHAFPAGFLWGSSTAGHQIEGGSSNDWTDWESSAKRLAELEKSGLIKKYGQKNFISGRSTGHYEKFREDFQLAKELGHTAFRFSIEWSRIEPEEGKWNETELAHYRGRVEALRELGIEPFLTLWHWPVPRWVRDQGGWESRKTVEDFSRYCEKVAKELPGVKFFITLNEPDIYSAHSYLYGEWPPQKKSWFAFWKVIFRLIAGHKRAYARIKAVRPGAQIGIAKHNAYFEAHNDMWLNKLLCKFMSWIWNRAFLNRIEKEQDFIGVNQYMHHRIHFGRNKNRNELMSDMSWELFPESMYHVLKELEIYKKPIYITENGLADATDKMRGWFIHETLLWVHRAIQEGVDVRGYLHWSLLDNFEWDKGYWPRFGLVEVDYETLMRKPRPSAFLYADISKTNAINADIREKHAALLKRPSK